MASESGSKIELLNDHTRAEIDHWVSRFPPEHKRSAVLQALVAAQHQNQGFLTNDLMDAVAEYLEMPPIAVYEVATFYTMYDLKPVGRHKIYVCTNISCMLCGSGVIVEHLERKLGIKLGETTADGEFTIKEAECLAACGGAPMFMLDDDYHENLTPEKVDAILDALE